MEPTTVKDESAIHPPSFFRSGISIGSQAGDLNKRFRKRLKPPLKLLTPHQCDHRSTGSDLRIIFVIVRCLRDSSRVHLQKTFTFLLDSDTKNLIGRLFPAGSLKDAGRNAGICCNDCWTSWTSIPGPLACQASALPLIYTPMLLAVVRGWSLQLPVCWRSKQRGQGQGPMQFLSSGSLLRRRLGLG